MCKSTSAEPGRAAPVLRLRRSGALWQGLLVFGLFACPAWSQVRSLSPTETQPPDAITAARHGTVQQFALAVARSRAPVGIFLPHEDAALGSYVEPSDLRVRAELPAEALQAFTETHRDYRIDRTAFDGLVIARRSGGPCVAVARSRVRTFVEGGSAFEILYRLHRTWSDDTSPYVTPGLLGNEDRDLYLAPVSISVADGTLENALNEVVQQVPGLGWSIRDENGGQACSLGLFTGRSWVQALDWTVPASGGGRDSREP